MHSKCPVGHDFAGLAACDAALNGPYTVGATVLKNLMERCLSDNTCTERSRVLLQFKFSDQANRVLSTNAATENVSADAKAGTNWNDEPEGSR